MAVGTSTGQVRSVINVYVVFVLYCCSLMVQLHFVYVGQFLPALTRTHALIILTSIFQVNLRHYAPLIHLLILALYMLFA